MKCLYNIFILIIIIKLIYSEFQILFKIKYNSNCYINDYCKEYYIDIAIGNPPQNLLLKIYQDKYLYYVINHEQKYEDIIYFNESQSSTIKIDKKDICIVYDELEYSYYAQDDIILNNMNITNMSFILGDTLVSPEDYKGYSGPLGLGILRQEVSHTKNLIKNLKEKDIIKSYDYSFTFNKDGNSGIIHIGERPDQYDSSHYLLNNYATTLIIASNNMLWEISIDTIELFGKKVDFDLSEISFKISLESNYISGIPELNSTLYNNFFSQYINSSICNIIKKDRYYYYYCNKSFESYKKSFGEIKIYIKNLNQSFIFDYNDLFIEKNDTIYFLIRFETFSVKKRIIIGDILFKKYLIVFNQDDKTIGVYSGNNKPISKNKSYILYIVIGIGFIVCLIAIIFLIKYIMKLKKKWNKKRAQEFQDDFEYVRTN